MIFENLYPAEKDKTPAWAQGIIYAISHYAQTSTQFNIERYKTFKNYDFMRGVYDMLPLQYLTDPWGQPTPARWEHYDFINVKIEKILGDYLSHPLSYYAHITNREGHERKLDLATKVATEQLTAQHRQSIQNLTGVDVSNPQIAAMSPEDQQAALKLSYKDAIEKFGEEALDYLINRYNIDVEYLKCLRDLCICSKAFTMTKIVNGDPISKRMDPRAMIWDVDTDSDTIETAVWVGYERYLTISQILQEGRNDYSKDQIKQLKAMTDDYITSLIKTNPSIAGFYKIAPQGGVRIRVIDGVFCSSKIKEFTKTDNPYDKEHPIYQELTDEYKETHGRWYRKAKRDGRVIELEGDDWWEGQMLGHDMFAKCRRMKDQPRSQSWGYAVSKSPFKGVIKDAIDGVTLSLVDRLEKIQILWDEVWFNIDFLLGRTNGKILQYDIAQMPDKMTKSQVMTLAKNHGFAFIDSRKEGIRSNAFNQFSMADASNTPDIAVLINVANSIEQVADTLIGSNRGWLGDTKASATVGNTQNDVTQANAIMRTLYFAHQRVVEQSLNGMADLFKYAGWKEGERMSYIIDDGTVNSFIIPEGFRDDDLGIKYKSGFEERIKMDQVNQMVQSALASGAIDFASALDIFDADTAAEAKAEFKQGIAIMQQNRLAAQQAQQQMAHEKIVADAQKAQTSIQVAQINAQALITATNIKEQQQTERNTFNKEVEKDLTTAKHRQELDAMALEATNQELPEPPKLKAPSPAV